jgi:hypothetical protein
MSKLFTDKPDIPPVWQVISRFFRYPFNASVLPVLALISVASLLTFVPVLGFFIWLLLWAMLFKLSYEILSSTASGMMDGPPSVTQMSDGIMFKHIGLLLGMGLAYGLLVGLSGSVLLAIGLGLFLMLALPAAMMTLAMTQSLLQALNPVIWIQIMRTTGWAYLLTTLFLLLMLMSQAQAEAWLLPLVGGSLALLSVISTFISGYFMAASFHLMGYLLYQFHEDLGIDVTATELRGPSNRDDQHPLVSEANALVREGQVDEAAKMLGEEIRLNGAERPVHDHYRKLLLSRGDRGALLEHGRGYIPMLMHSLGDKAAALDILADCLESDPGFRPANPDDILPLAQTAFAQRRHRLVLKLTSGFGKQYREHRDLAENYFLAAQSMLEQGEPPDRPVNLVRQLRKRFPDHPLSEDMARFEASFGDTMPGGKLSGSGP